MHNIIEKEFAKIMRENGLESEKVTVYANPLSPEEAIGNPKDRDYPLVTGSTIVNNTIDQFWISKPVIFYGITISGAAKLLGLSHFCYYGH